MRALGGGGAPPFWWGGQTPLGVFIRKQCGKSPRRHMFPRPPPLEAPLAPSHGPTGTTPGPRLHPPSLPPPFAPRCKE